MARMREGTTTEDYRKAIFGSKELFSLGYEWKDKPHRLIYDLCGEIDALNERIQFLENADNDEEIIDVDYVPRITVHEGNWSHTYYFQGESPNWF